MGRGRPFRARATVLATGGIGGLYALTTNPPAGRWRGAGHGRAGRRRASPTPNSCNFTPPPSILAAIPRRWPPKPCAAKGRLLVNRAGQRFMPALHKDAELAPRDIVARGVFAEIAAGRGAYPRRTRSGGRGFRGKIPQCLRGLPFRRHRPGARKNPRRAGRALPHGRIVDRCARKNLPARPVGGGRSRLDRPAWRQSPRLQFAAGSGGVRRPRRPRHRARTFGAPARRARCRRAFPRRPPEATPKRLRRCGNHDPPRRRFPRRRGLEFRLAEPARFARPRAGDAKSRSAQHGRKPPCSSPPAPCGGAKAAAAISAPISRQPTRAQAHRILHHAGRGARSRTLPREAPRAAEHRRDASAHESAPTPSISLLVEEAVRAALAEDFGRAGDITSSATIPASAQAHAADRGAQSRA